MWRILDNHYSEGQMLCALLGAFIISLVVTPVVRELAKRKSLLDQPNHRSSHSTPVPRLGGVAIALGSVFGALVLIGEVSWQICLLGGAAVIVALAGFYDDLRSISAVQKYAPQVVAAVMAGWALQPRVDILLPFASFRVPGLLAVLLSAFWITAFINAYNFMDGIDGIAGGVGLVTAVGLTVLTTGNAAFMLLPLAAALAGFLLWNISPASIFMGDGGSQFVGFMLATGALYWPGSRVNFVAVLIAFAPFLFDTGFTLVWRLWKQMDVFHAHRSHLYQRLTVLGLGHREVANLYIAATALCLGGAAAYVSVGAAIQTLLMLLMTCVAVSYVRYVSLREVSRPTIQTTRRVHSGSFRGAGRAPSREEGYYK